VVGAALPAGTRERLAIDSGPGGGVLRTEGRSLAYRHRPLGAERLACLVILG